MEATMEMRKSNLVLPQGFVEMDRDEMMYVDGGISISSAGLYLTNDDLFCITVAVGCNAYAVAAGISAFTSWICATGVGSVIWALFSVSSIYVAIKALGALSEGKGLMIGLEYTKIFGIKIPSALDIYAK